MLFGLIRGLSALMLSAGFGHITWPCDTRLFCKYAGNGCQESLHAKETGLQITIVTLGRTVTLSMDRQVSPYKVDNGKIVSGQERVQL